MMKVRKVKPYLVGEFDVEMVYRALLHYTDSLEKFKSWMDKEEVECSSCGGQRALKNMQEEIDEFRKLSTEIYFNCFHEHVEKHVERPNRAKRVF